MEKNLSSTLPVLIELDDQSWENQLDNVEAWFDNLLLTQVSFRQLLEDTIEKIEEPHIKKYLFDILERAKKHENAIEELYSTIGRESSKIRNVLGEFMGKARQALGDFIAISGKIKGPWQDVHQLYLSNQNSMGAFAVAEQLGLALGLPSIVEIAFPIVAEKSTDQLLLQEYVLEMCSLSILYKENM